MTQNTRKHPDAGRSKAASAGGLSVGQGAALSIGAVLGTVVVGATGDVMTGTGAGAGAA